MSKAEPGTARNPLVHHAVEGAAEHPVVWMGPQSGMQEFDGLLVLAAEAVEQSEVMKCDRVIRVSRQRFPIGSLSVGPSSKVDGGKPGGVVRNAVIWSCLNQELGCLQGGFRFSAHRLASGKLIQAAGAFRVESGCGSRVPKRGIECALSFQEHAENDMRVRKFRVTANGSPDSIDGLFPIAKLPMRIRKIDVCFGVVGFASEKARDFGDGLLVAVQP